jgi:capsular exopolysaccharide synthesis family protein
VTSAAAGEGKTSIATNLAISWAQAGASVCLVEADLRRPGVSEFLGIDGTLGLSDVLVGERDLDQVLVPWNHDMLTVLPAGSLPPDPAALLGSSGMATLVTELRDRFDVVIYDTPPMLSVTDAVVLGAHVDGVVLVIRSASTRRDQVVSCLEILRRARLALLGSVVGHERQRGRGAEHEYTAELGKDRAELAPLVQEPDEADDTVAPDELVVEADERGGSSFWLGGGRGRLLMPTAGSGTGLRVEDVSGSANDVRVRFGLDKGTTGDGVRLTIGPRVLENADRYFAELDPCPEGGLRVGLGLEVGGVERRLWEDSVPDLHAAADEPVQVRVRARGTSPTTLEVKVWHPADEEPEEWTGAVTDDTAELQAPGGVALGTRLSATATNAPVLAVLDDLRVGTGR